MDETPEAAAAVVRTPEAAHLAVQSGQLFGTEREIVIIHREQRYRLRITRADKLILTK